MASNKPVVRQRSWLASILHVLLVLVFTIIFTFCVGSIVDGFDLTLLVFFIAYLLLRFLVPKNHQQGVELYRSGDYAQAISEFEKSYAFFTKHAWIDKYRYIVLLSASKISYTEKSLINIAVCYIRMGDVNKAKEYYENTLSQFPDSEMAKMALQKLNAAANTTSTPEE